MKKVILITLVLVMGVMTNQTFAQKAETKTVCFKSSMDCENCQKTLTEYLKFEKGVKDLKVDFTSNTVMIEYKDGKNSDEKLAKAIEKKGYTAEKISTEEYKKIVAAKETEGHSHDHDHNDDH
ncbi:MAG: heavy-metal-associated domain-containing protein [Mariniphaga sp.]|nr:heavy-metal-associated domain-containing protein [Mariniphaga sp.]